MGRFTTDVIASCAFGINSQSLKNPDEEFSRYVRNLSGLDLMRGLALLLAFLAPIFKNILRLKFLDGKTTNYIRQMVWSTGEYCGVHWSTGEKHRLITHFIKKSPIL
jgi:cytochrome P450 family 6